jgi:hypothetical protein
VAGGGGEADASGEADVGAGEQAEPRGGIGGGWSTGRGAHVAVGAGPAALRAGGGGAPSGRLGVAAQAW